jgi:Concanavalin A-like lectin/glucanases superfamily
MCKRLIYLIPGVFCLSLVSTRVARADLVGWWKLDDGAGTTAIDSSGYGNDGTLIAGKAGLPVWKTGGGDVRIGTGALEFHGGSAEDEGDLVDCGNSPVFDITENITFALWVKIDAFTMTYQYVFSKGLNYMILRANDTRYLRVVFNGLDTGAGGDAYYAGGTTIPIDDGQWHHVAGSYDSSTGTVAFYTDGILEESKTSSGSIPTNDEPLCIGMRRTRKGIDAIIDDVRLYNHTLTAAEIRSAMQGQAYPFASGPIPDNGAVNSDTWINLSWHPGEFAVSHDVYLGDDFDVVSEATRDSNTFRGNQTAASYVAGFPGYAYPEGLEPGTTYYWRIDEVNEAEPNSPWKGPIWSFSIPPRTAYGPNPADGSGLTGTSVTLSWTAGFGAKLHTMYFGDDYDTVANATDGIPVGMTNYTPSQLETEKVYYWRVDEFDGLGTYKGDVWTFTTTGAVGNPQPANGAADVAMATTLSWTAATNATSHQVYLGLDKQAVRSADTGSPEYKGPQTLGVESYDAGLLEPDTTYYWRVDEVYAGNTVKGPVWSFAVGDYLVVDDFESYTDDDTAGQAIWQAWIDGFGIADNGAQVGYLMPPYAEQTIVHSGSQSMPLLYDNTLGVQNSEATLTLTTTHDWTAAGVGELSLWFRGNSANAAEPLYVAISNSAGAPAVVANDDADAATFSAWKQWRVSLQAFADQGINLSNVAKIAIGLGRKSGMPAVGGTGTVYIDDIRLDRPSAP